MVVQEGPVGGIIADGYQRALEAWEQARATNLFHAQAVDSAGRIVPGMRFRWTSSNPEVAEIDEFTGLATGGLVSGQTEINAQLICDEQ